MTVRELIAQLEQYPSDHDVTVLSADYYEGEIGWVAPTLEHLVLNGELRICSST